MSQAGGQAGAHAQDRTAPARGSGNTGRTDGWSGASRGARGCGGLAEAWGAGVDDGPRARCSADARVTPPAPWPGESRERPDPTRGPRPPRPPRQGRGEAAAVTTAGASATRRGLHESHAASRDAPGRPARSKRSLAPRGAPRRVVCTDAVPCHARARWTRDETEGWPRPRPPAAPTAARPPPRAHTSGLSSASSFEFLHSA